MMNSLRVDDETVLNGQIDVWKGFLNFGLLSTPGSPKTANHPSTGRSRSSLQ